MNRKLIFLPLLLLFISCTVTKRVHRPGFHIQWHKAQKVSDVHAKSEEQTDAKLAIEEQDEIIIRSNQAVRADSSKTAENRPEIELKSKELLAKSSLRKSIALIQPEKSVRGMAAIHSIVKIAKSTKKHSKRPLFWRISAENLQTIGIVLMVLGGIILFGSLLVSTGAFSGGGGGSPNDGGGNSGVWINFFLDLIGASGWFWLLVFILIFIFVAYLAFLLVRHVLGGPLAGLIVGLCIVALGLFFFILGKSREIDA